MQPFESCFIRKVTMVKAVVMAILAGHYIVPSMESLRNVSKMDYLRALSTEIFLKEKYRVFRFQASEEFLSIEILNFCGNELKQFGVASYANRDCKKLTGWWSPSHVMKWIQKNSDYRQTFPISFLNFLLHK